MMTTISPERRKEITENCADGTRSELAVLRAERADVEAMRHIAWLEISRPMFSGLGVCALSLMAAAPHMTAGIMMSYFLLWVAARWVATLHMLHLARHTRFKRDLTRADYLFSDYLAPWVLGLVGGAVALMNAAILVVAMATDGYWDGEMTQTGVVECFFSAGCFTHNWMHRAGFRRLAREGRPSPLQDFYDRENAPPGIAE